MAKRGRPKKNNGLTEEDLRQIDEVIADNDKAAENDTDLKDNSEDNTEKIEMLAGDFSENESKPKSKYKAKKEKKEIFYKTVIGLPIMLLDMVFTHFQVSLLDENEKKQLEFAFEGVIHLFPEKVLKFLEKSTPFIVLVAISYKIAKKRAEELKLKQKKETVKKTENNQDNDIIEDFKSE